MKLLRILISVTVIALFASCVKDDIPYPTITVNIENMEGEGFTLSNINLNSRVVTLRLDEKTDIRKVDIAKVEYGIASSNPMMTDTARFIGMIRPSHPLTGEFDLQSPMEVTLTLYQDYLWTVQAEQTIERAFTVAGQIGATVIDTASMTATVHVAAGSELDSIVITTLKLGPADITTYSPTLEELSGSDFSEPRTVDVTCHGRTETWTLVVEMTDKKLGVTDVDLWANTASITAHVTPAEYPNAIVEYRLAGTDEWQSTLKGSLNESGIFTSAIEPQWTESTNEGGLAVKQLVASKGLFAGKTYEFQLIIDGVVNEILEYTTAEGGTIPYGSMEDSSMSCFTLDNKTSTSWASGNNSLSRALCTQAIYPAESGSYCAKLASTSVLSILAAGNLMTGTFSMLGTTGTVGFGQYYNWIARPTAMKVKYHASIGIVDISKHAGAPIGKGDQDRARIMVAIVDWNNRHDVTSGTKAPVGIWDPTLQSETEEGKIIAYGSLFIEQSTEGDDMIEVTLPLNFYEPDAAAPMGLYTLVISTSTSAYGDYMVGCKTNVMYLKDFEWVY